MRALLALIAALAGCTTVSPQLPRGSCASSRWIEEPPVADEYYVWVFDGSYWRDELAAIAKQQKGQSCDWPFWNKTPAASYSPTGWPLQYHRPG